MGVKMEKPDEALRKLMLKVVDAVVDAAVSPDWRAHGDPRDNLWAIATEFEPVHGGRRRSLMSFLSWLYFKQGVHDLEVLRALSGELGRAKSPYAYFRPGSKYLEALVGSVAVARAEGEKAARQAADQKLGIARKP